MVQSQLKETSLVLRHRTTLKLYLWLERKNSFQLQAFLWKSPRSGCELLDSLSIVWQ